MWVAWPNAVGAAQPGVAAAAGVARSDVAEAGVVALRGAAAEEAQPDAAAVVALAAAEAPGARDVPAVGRPSAVA